MPRSNGASSVQMAKSGGRSLRPNPPAHPIRPTPALPYPDAQAHLRDELWRVWLRVELEVRCRAERDPAGFAETWSPDDFARLFRAARIQYQGGDRTRSNEGSAGTLRDAFLLHSAAVEARVAATVAAGFEPPLIRLARCFALTLRERAALAFAIAPEVDPDLLMAYRRLVNDPSCRGFEARHLAMLVYDAPESRALLARDLSHRGALLFHCLLEPDGERGGESLLYRGLRPAPRIVEMLNGDQPALDASLAELAELRDDPEPGFIPEAIVAQAESALRGAGIVLAVQGIRGTGKRLLARTAAARLGLRTLVIDGRVLARRSSDAQRMIARALMREARLLEAVPVLADVDEGDHGTERSQLPPAASQLCREHGGPVVMTFTGERLPPITERPMVHLTLGIPGLAERAALWRRQVPELTDDDAMALASRFAAPGGTIVFAARAACATHKPDDGPPDIVDIDRAVRTQLHDRISRLGRALETPYSFDDLIVSEDVWNTLCEIVAAMSDRRVVREFWGLRGAPGVSVLFSGDPGVGKTMSATVLARHLGLAIYEVDLSRITSKWIGETEKNLAEVFDAAEPGHVVLLFNEADSLFGKRTGDVKSANDRYANLETNYLLQRLERFGGLAILTTNLGKAIDPAFRRRFAYDVQFTFPTPEMRAELWKRALPPAAVADGVAVKALAQRYALSGAFIKVAVERAAFVAAACGELITMDLLETTIERMYRERGKLTAIGQLE